LDFSRFSFGGKEKRPKEKQKMSTNQKNV
jgi:hypothetical protein